MELQDVLNERRSIRSYDADKKVTKEQLEIIINAAILAPSWKNLQTSRYYCILSDEMIKEFSDKCLPEFNQKNSEGAALVVTTFFRFGIWESLAAYPTAITETTCSVSGTLRNSLIAKTKKCFGHNKVLLNNMVT